MNGLIINKLNFSDHPSTGSGRTEKSLIQQYWFGTRAYKQFHDWLPNKAALCWFPSSSLGTSAFQALVVVLKQELQRPHSQAGVLIVIHKCRQTGKHRHIGMDADIQAMDGNHPTVQVPDSGDLPTRSFPSVD